MRLCEECRYSEIKVTPRKNVRVCQALPGKPLCLNAREFWWDKQNQERECGPEGRLWEHK